MKIKYLFFCIIAVIVSFGCFYYHKYIDYPVDLVYLWVDGSDPVWLAKKEYWRKKMDIKEPDAVCEARWRDREELLHSLRSVSMYMPWVRKIFIITDNQVPSWLNTDHPKIQIIDHKDILPADSLPVFNAPAIESAMPNINGLSEHFIYFNDDVFVGAPLSKDFFFNHEKKPILYSDNRKNGNIMSDYMNSPNIEHSVGYKMATHTFITATKKIHTDYTRLNDVIPMHTFSAYLKSTYLKTNQLFADEIKKSRQEKFRSASTILRNIVTYYDLSANTLEIRDSTNVKGYSCDIAGLLIMDNMDDLVKFRPCTFCLNDYQTITPKTIEDHIHYLRNRFPNKSEFEK